MIAIVDTATGAIVRIAHSLDGIDMTGFEALPPPEGFDPMMPAHRRENGAWVANLTWHRRQAWERIKAARDQAENGGCATPLGRVDTDPLSRDRISGAVQMAMIVGAAFSIDWTMEDNGAVAHNQAAMIALGLAVGQHVGAVHATARALRVLIDAAATVEQLEAIEWPE
jgi:hypothetical protein